MKICDKKEGYKHPEFIVGNIYREETGGFYIAADIDWHGHAMVSLSEGHSWTEDVNNPMGKSGVWQDVTDKVCLDVSGVES